MTEIETKDLENLKLDNIPLMTLIILDAQITAEMEKRNVHSQKIGHIKVEEYKNE